MIVIFAFRWKHTKGLVGPIEWGKTITMLFSLLLCFEEEARIFDSRQDTFLTHFHIWFSYYWISWGSLIQKQRSKLCKPSSLTVLLPIHFLDCTKNNHNTKVNREEGISANPEVNHNPKILLWLEGQDEVNLFVLVLCVIVYVSIPTKQWIFP